MTMEPIQNKTALYQGSGTPVEKVQSRKTEQMPQAEEVATKANSVENAVQNSAQNEKSEKLVTPEQASDSSLKKAVEEINRKSSNTEAVFGYHEGTKRVTIKIMDKETKEVKREYPAEKTLDMIQKVWEMAGLMVDEKR
ncbi:MAG: flagellar protein FlaG [Eubacterium sp.]|nr:flagellar protein FlaG [Eubacterium sp.]